ncbi:MAG TPA: metalloprotease family protein [Candidatus Polarisedimenticolaceae bacterium]|nr:metalloprotease family protein [Candidatus Polarisedimenticolaceae bacterium]
MFFIPGFLISLFTFPGVIVHEAAHMLFCRLRGLAVLDVCFFRIGNPAGYVIHEETEDFTSAFLVSVGPLFVNSILCIVFCFPAFVPVRIFDRPDPVSLLLLWLGISIGMHAFPSTHDANNVWRLARQQAKSLKPLVLLSFPLVIAIYAANLLSVVWFDCFYGFALGLILPEFLFRLLV